MEDVLKFKIINKLKSVYRFNSVDKRKESSAEHSWSCLILADFLMNKYDFKVNRLRVYELLMYHDLVELIVGDTPLTPNSLEYDSLSKVEKEKIGAQELKSLLPKEISQKYFDLFMEYEDCESRDAKFAKAIDKLDAGIHELDYKDDWKGWTEEFLRTKKQRYFEEFPELMKVFEDNIKYLKENMYLDK